MSTRCDAFVEDLHKFTDASMNWCIRESEKSTMDVTTTIDILLRDTERISKLSENSINAIERFKENLKELMKGRERGDRVMNLLLGLKTLSQEHEDLKSVIEPLIKALQFQDRLRQNLENMSRMMDIWLEMRKTVKETGGYTKEMEIELGTRIGTKTTMKEERDIIRKHIPEATLPEEMLSMGESLV
ncbi:MAG: hypothetical protein HQK54_17715 [Oligoflexales bacterium]|nr:hypothetical protein [Oligoflexales bacterium]